MNLHEPLDCVCVPMGVVLAGGLGALVVQNSDVMLSPAAGLLSKVRWP